MAAINQRHLRHRRREPLEPLERLEHLEHLRQHRRREPLEKLEHQERPERLVLLEHLVPLRQHQKKSRRGITGYILAKRIYPKSLKEEVDYEIKVIELQIDSTEKRGRNLKEDYLKKQSRKLGKAPSLEEMEDR